MMVGEDAENPDPKAFNNKPVLSRIAVIAAGPVFNFILAFLFAMIIVAQVGHDAPVLTGVMEGSPAEEAGLQAGDCITKINGLFIHAFGADADFGFAYYVAGRRAGGYELAAGLSEPFYPVGPVKT